MQQKSPWQKEKLSGIYILQGKYWLITAGKKIREITDYKEVIRIVKEQENK